MNEFLVNAIPTTGHPLIEVIMMLLKKEWIGDIFRKRSAGAHGDRGFARSQSAHSLNGRQIKELLVD